MNPYVDGYIKTLNYQKILREMQRNNNLMKIKRIVNPKYVGRGPYFTLRLPGGRFASLPAVSYTTGGDR